jgi:malonate-semialdehyde dehydrogenase (acetylating)/methylmalonate-semialdehyde dehydrogenase
MVPFWTLPIIIATGNTLVLKPSEKVPLTMTKVMELLQAAGLPPGVVNLVQGTVETVNALVDHPLIRAVTFVGTSRVAELISHRGRSLNKRVLALGGAKNHLIAVPDCLVDMTASDIVASFTGCSGQRCMAASVLLTVGDQPELIKVVCEKAKAIEQGQLAGQMGPVIDRTSLDKIHKYIDEAEKAGAKILLDGRPWTTKNTAGFWIGPTVILHSNKNDKALHEEIFGPVISIYVCKTKEEAIAIENGNPYGNAGICQLLEIISRCNLTLRYKLVSTLLMVVLQNGLLNGSLLGCLV